MKRYEVDFKDYATGATSPIDEIEVHEGYTPYDYLRDYKNACDGGLENIYDNGEILFFEIEYWEEIKTIYG